MIPSRKEMMDYWFEHPIAGTVIAFGMVEGIKTIWESLVNAEGDSPFSTYTNIRSGDALDDISIGHLTPKQKKELEEVTTGLKAASKMHAQQSKQLTAASKMHAKQARTIEQLGSSSTTTSTSSAHGGTVRTQAGSTWDKHSMPGEKVQMFGGPKKKGSVLMGPPSMRRRISINSITLGGLSKAPQELGKEEEALPTTEHFGLLGMMPEQSDDATDNPWV